MQDEEIDAEMEELVNDIQVGDKTEGARALKKALARGTGDTRGAVRAELAALKFEAENNAALQRFADKYPDLVQDEILGDAGQTAVRREIENDLKKIGVTDEVLAPVRGNTQLMVRGYTEARMRGAKVRSPDEIFDATGKVLSERFGLHPKSRRVSPGERIAEMRAERGFAEEADGGGRSVPRASVQRTDSGNVRRVGSPANVRQAPRSEPSGRPSTADWIAKQRAARGFADLE
jgi:hypothetical protein